jgi:DNA repair photolyase
MKKQKGRGAQINTKNRFHQHHYEREVLLEDMEEDLSRKTKYVPVYPKTVLNKITSPDLPMEWSINPYQGCEHGCVYCYARNTHSYWGYSAGLDFEQTILVKKDAPAILEKKLKHPKWVARPIMLSGNTDCYQPAEQKWKITRAMLEVFWKLRHPVGIITKNKLILRDLDLLEQLAQHDLVKVAISVTTLDESLRQFLEPRTSTGAARLETIERLAEKGIPVSVMAAPIIPGLNEHEILPIARAAAERGARAFHHTLVRLNGDVAVLFEDWLERFFPDRKAKVLSKIRQCRGGKLGESRFGKRMAGEGEIAEIIRKQVRLARATYFKEVEAPPPYNCELHEQFKNDQLRLF